jgi:hypothetical protein
MYLDSEKAKADANYYAIKKSFEAEQNQLTPQYLRKLAIQTFSDNTELYLGESIPKYLGSNQ